MTDPANLPPLDFGAPLWLFDDRTVAAMLYEATSFARDPANDEDLTGTAEAVRQHVQLQADLRGVDAAPLPPHDPTGCALYAALSDARDAMIAVWMAEPERKGCFDGDFPGAVHAFGCPEHIHRATEALRAASPTA